MTDCKVLASSAGTPEKERDMVKLGDICVKASSNIKQSDLEGRSGAYPIYGASGWIRDVDFYEQDKPYVAVVKDGAGAGRVMYLPERSSVIGTMQYIIPNADINARYLAYAMDFMKLSRYCMGATIPHIYFKDYCKEELPAHSRPEQDRIASALGKMDDCIRLRERQLEKLDELVKSKFVEMFGDPITNPYGWKTAVLSELGYLKNGMNFHENDSGVELYCLGVGDFQDRYKITDMSILHKISLNEFPSSEYMLQDGDILFVRSNGNKNLVGRSITIYPKNVPTTFSGFCIRFRNTSRKILIPYLQFMLKAKSVRAKLTGRGVNIQNLNQKMLSDLPVPIPPLDLQGRFAGFVEEVDKTKSAVRRGLSKLETLKAASMQRYFAP